MNNAEVIRSHKDIDLSSAIVIDSTLIKTFRACPQKYNYFNIQHYVPKSRKSAPSFGIAMHEGIAVFRQMRMSGKRYPEAVEIGQAALQKAYTEHMPLEAQSEVMQDDRRSITNAIRLYHGFCQHFEPCGYTYTHIEVPFALWLGQIKVPNLDIDGTWSGWILKDVIYTGIIDAVLEFGGLAYVTDIKTTGMNITESWLDGFKMDQGLPGYLLAARELLGANTNHAMVHAMWIQKEPKSGKGKPLDEYFHTKPLYWDEDQLAEWQQNTLRTVGMIEEAKGSNRYIMDFGASSCNSFGVGCDYRNVCSLTPSARPQRLEMDYRKALWTPLEDERLQPLED